MKNRLNQVFDDLVGQNVRESNLLTDMDKLIMIVEELAAQVEKKADEDHSHTLI